jgi:hypothetical protein
MRVRPSRDQWSSDGGTPYVAFVPTLMVRPPVPSGDTTIRENCPPDTRKNAIAVPSGDHTGCTSAVGAAPEILRNAAPSRVATMRSAVAECSRALAVKTRSRGATPVQLMSTTS